MVQSAGAEPLESVWFITLATWMATWRIRSASTGTSSGPSALPPGVFLASLTTSSAVTGEMSKASGGGSCVPAGSDMLMGSCGGGALTMLAKKSRSSFLRSAAESPARLSAVRLFRPVRVYTAFQTCPAFSIRASCSDGLHNTVYDGLLLLFNDAGKVFFRIFSRPSSLTEHHNFALRSPDGRIVFPRRLMSLGRSHWRHCPLGCCSYGGTNFRVVC